MTQELWIARDRFGYHFFDGSPEWDVSRRMWMSRHLHSKCVKLDLRTEEMLIPPQLLSEEHARKMRITFERA